LLLGGAAAEAGRGAGHRAGGVAVVEAGAVVAVLHVPAVVAEHARAQLGGDLGAGIVADREALLGVGDGGALAGIAGVGLERRAGLVVAAHQEELPAAEADLRVAAAAVAGLVVVLAADGHALGDGIADAEQVGVALVGVVADLARAL